MKLIKQLNEDNEKTEVYCATYTLPKNEWVNFEFDGLVLSEKYKTESGRGGELLKLRYPTSSMSGVKIDVKCSKTNLKGVLYWKHAIKNTIAKIEWEDGVVREY